MASTPGSILPGGVVLIDEPDGIGLNTFAANGEVIMSINTRPGGNCAQVIIGLTPNMALQLIDILNKHSDVYTRAIALGKGGARFQKP